ncbi:MAG: glycosyltransferase family 39 protein [Deltaproteobacteria bacterium]|nr:glycosyltransferase family 39 protein [Deltaproteobacteria bacterium]
MTEAPHTHSCTHWTPSCKLLALLAILIIFGKTIAFYLLGQERLIWDSHWYLTLAEQLASTGSYTLGDGDFHSKYPPGFPILVAVAGRLLGSFQTAGALIVFTASVLLCLLVFLLGRRLAEERELPGKSAGVLACLLFATHHLSLVHSNLILTEQVFALFAVACLMFATRLRLTPRDIFLALILAGAASLIRYEGLLLFPVLAWSWRRSADQLPAQASKQLLMGLLVVGLAWSAWIAALVSHGASAFGGQYGKELAQLSWASALDFLLLALWIGPLFLILSFIGLAKILRQPSSTSAALAAFCSLYFISHLCWWFSDIRFYVVLLPFLAVCAGFALIDFTHRLFRDSKGLRIAFLALAMAALCSEQRGMLHATEYEYRRYNALYLHQYDPIEELGTWSLKNLPQGTFAVPEPAVYRHYLLGREVIPYSALPQVLSSGDAQVYLVIDNLHFRNEDLQSALDGAIKVRTPHAEVRELPVQILYKAERRETADDTRYAAVAAIKGKL